MCFSAPVSFGASAFVATAGVLAIRAATRNTERPLACVPLLFAAQQLIEGVLWLILPSQGATPFSQGLTQAYAAFIGIVWPVLIPLSIGLVEPSLKRRRLIEIVLLIGVVVAAYTLAILLRYGVSVHIANQCLVYQNPLGGGLLIDATYLIATCAAFFISSHMSVKWMGAANVAGFIVAYTFYHLNYPSVWCFFAALMSALIYLYFRRQRVSSEHHA